MGFFDRPRGGDGDDADELGWVEAGGIPDRARERLTGLTGEGSLFTSGLSVNEFALLGRLGSHPLGQVMGASVIRTGWQYLPALDPGGVSTGWQGGRTAGLGPTVTGRALQNRVTEASPSQVRTYRWRTAVVCELAVIAEAWNLARRRALGRLREEARILGADAVVGVHLHRGDHDLGGRTVEYVVNGTAIRLPDSAGSAQPALTDASAQEYWALRCGGHEAVGLVAATAVAFASPSRSDRIRRARTTPQSQELDELRDGFSLARAAVRKRLLSQVSEAGATGVVGVAMTHSVHAETIPLASSLQSDSRRGWQTGRLGIPYRVTGRGDAERRGWVITMHAAGTAIRGARDPIPLRPLMSLRPPSH